jgi:hypothetical protein
MEKDPKNYLYFMRYYQLNNTCTEFLKLDNQIQVEEINIHLSKYSEDEHNKQTFEWTRQNGENFRNYINTIKIICLVFKCMNKTNITQDEFFDMESYINNLKGSCLETIF